MQYMEVLVRFAKYFTAQPSDIPAALNYFFSSQGLRHKKIAIRTRLPETLELVFNLIIRCRAAYTLMRFMKVVRSQLLMFAADIISSLRDFLCVITDEDLVGRAALDWRIFFIDAVQTIPEDDQLFLFEAAGSVITIDESNTAVGPPLPASISLSLFFAGPGYVHELDH